MRKKSWEKGAIVLACFLLTVGFCGWQIKKQERIRQQSEPYLVRMEEEKRWILENQWQDGAIFLYEVKEAGKERVVNPYFACIAARGLLAGEASAKELDAVERYLSWHVAHLQEADENSPSGKGTIEDYHLVMRGQEAVWEADGGYDSVDSYAALFLILTEEYMEEGGSRECLAAWKEDILTVMDVLAGCSQDGLSKVSVANETRYLMDNAEVNQALRDSVKLLKRLARQEKDKGEKRRLRERGERMASQAEQNSARIEALLWKEEEGRYETGLDKKMKPLRYADENGFYPNGVAQIFPMVYGLLEPDGDRAKLLYENFCRKHQWQGLEHRKKGEAFFWSMSVYEAACMGDFSRVDAYLAASGAALGEEGRDYPFHTAESGWIALACGEIVEHIR